MPNQVVWLNSTVGDTKFFVRKFTRQFEAEIIPIVATTFIHNGLKPKAITEQRVNTFFPWLDKMYPNVPLVVGGSLAAKLVMGGNPTETSMVGKTYEIGGRLIAFTYDVSYAEDIHRSHAAITIRSVCAGEHAIEGYESSTKDKLHRLCNLRNETLIVDVETTDKTLPWYDSRVVMVGFLPEGEPPFALRPEDITDEAKTHLAMKVKTIVAHNAQFDLLHLKHIGITFPFARIHDTMIFEKCKGRTRDSYGLKYLAKTDFGFPHWDAWFNTQLKNKIPTDQMDWDKLVTYNAGDLYATHALYTEQKKVKRIPTFALEMDYLRYVLELISNGMYVDVAKLDALAADAEMKYNELDKAIRSEYGLGEDFNFNSPIQLLSLLRRDVSETITDTGIETLEKFQDEAPIIKSLVTLRDLAKLKGTSLEGIKKYVDSNSLVHTSLQVHGAETGRSTSSAPNLQNTDPRSRCVFISRRTGGRLLHTDLSGIEYRLIAHASRDRRLVKLFQNKQDIHSFAFHEMFGRDPIDKVERKIGKTANFGGVYGCAFPKFSALTGLEGDAGRKAFKVVSGMYPGVEKWKSSVIAKLRMDGVIKNLFGRTRYFESASMNDEREAINWIIQSSGHDILKIYSMELCDRFVKAGLSDVLLISEVHDSNTFDVPEEQVKTAVDIVLTLAQNINPLIEEYFNTPLIVPITADVEVMECWA